VAEGEFRISLAMAEKMPGLRITDDAGQYVQVQWAATTATFRGKNHALYEVQLPA
jgi:hypothetical protein